MPIVKRKLSRLQALAEAHWSLLQWVGRHASEDTVDSVSELIDATKGLIEPILRGSRSIEWHEPTDDDDSASDDSEVADPTSRGSRA